MTRLHDLGSRLAIADDLPAQLEQILRAALEITGAPMGNIQTCSAAGELAIAAQLGFQQPFLDHFARVDAGSDSACGAALAARARFIAEDVSSCPAFAGASSRAALLVAGVAAVQSTPLFDRSGQLTGMFSTHFRESHSFGEDELRWLDLLARHAGDVLERHRVAAQLADTREELQRSVAERTRWLDLMHEISRAMIDASSWDEALRQILQRICQLGNWQIGHLYLRDSAIPGAITPIIGYVSEARFEPFQALSRAVEQAGGQRLPERVYASGTPIWLDDPDALYRNLPLRAEAARQANLRAVAGLPIMLNRDVIAVLELLSDQSHPPSEPLSSLMRDVTDQIARVLDRERATARMAELLWREQQDLLHTLHDSLGQTLTGLGMLSRGLQERLTRTDPGAAGTANEIARQARQALGQVRQLTKSLFPVDVESETLTAALRDLASATESLHGIRIHVDGEAPPLLHDGRIATQLYRIAQEAVTNAVRHAHAHAITIRLAGDDHSVRLQVADDGVGIRNDGPCNGMGLKIMRYRAHSIGGQLTLESPDGRGTVITCAVRPSPDIGAST